MPRRAVAAAAILIAVAMLAVACSSNPTGGKGGGQGGKPTVRVGSKIDTEGQLLGQMIILMLEKNGIRTEDKTQTGQTNIVRSALLAGDIDIYPEYTGTAIDGFFGGEKIDPGTSKDATRSYETVKRLDLEKNKIVWLAHSPANNTFAIAVTKKLAEANGMVNMEDFAMYVNDGGQVKLAASQEFADRADGLQAFEKTYGFTLNTSQLQLFSGGNTTQTEQAAANGTGGVNAAMAYGTDGSISALSLVVLPDPKGAQAVFQPAPTVRQSVLNAYPKLPEILDPVFESLTLTTLQSLNGQIAVEGKPAKTVAEEYLKSKGFLK